MNESDKARLVKEYSLIIKNVDELEQYHVESRRKLETMSLLGVVAGFMSHEATRIVGLLRDSLEKLGKIVKTHPGLLGEYEELNKSYQGIKDYIKYTQHFINATNDGYETKFKAEPQIDMVLKYFGEFARERNIKIEVSVDESVYVPKMSVAVYSGVLLNLYSNALKALLSINEHKSDLRIYVRAWNDEKFHNLEVCDTGIGIAPNLQQRIWDAGFTTTSRLTNPLGTGMGLGLPLIKELVEKMHGYVRLVDAPEGFSTCFRVVFPLEEK